MPAGHKVPREVRAGWAARYEAGESLADIAKSDGCTTSNVWQVLTRQGVEMRAAKGRSKFDVAEAVRLFTEENWSQQRIADKFGVSQPTIGRHLRKAGITAEERQSRNHGNYKGGRVSYGNGYVAVLIQPGEEFHDMTMSNGYVMEHRLVMARSLGRDLRPDESVHHVDGDRANNDLSNLQLRQGQHGTGVVAMCGDCGSHNVAMAPLA